MTNKEKAHAINIAVQKADFNAIGLLVSENYIQHTPAVPDGRRGLMVLLEKIKNKQIPAPVITNVRTFEDGDFVLLHHDVLWPNKKVMFEIFRFEEGMAVEHWSGISDQPEATVNGHTMIDGAREISDVGKTEENKVLIKNFLQNVFVNGHFDKMSNFLHPKLIQHNPSFDDTLEGFIKGVQRLQQKDILVEIQKIHYVLGEGNFVLALSEGKFGDKRTAFFDLFRIEDNKIVEHWDVLQEVPEKMAHENGMFKRSLYKRIGGYDAIAGFVDFAFPRVAAHPNLAHFFVGHSNESKYRQRQLIVDKLASTLQGPVVYIGRPLASVHRGLNITPEHWNTFVKIIGNAMDECLIRGDEKQDFIEIFHDVFRPVTVEEEMKN